MNIILLHYSDGTVRCVDSFTAKHGSKFNNLRPSIIEMSVKLKYSEFFNMMISRLDPRSGIDKYMRCS